MKPPLLQQALAAVSVEAFSERAAEELHRIHAAAKGPERAKIGELFEVLLSMADDDQRLWLRELRGSAAGRGDSALDGEEPAREPEQLEEGEGSDQGDDEPIDWGNVFSEAKAMIELNPNATGD